MEIITTLEGLIAEIEGQEKKFHIGNIIYSSGGIISAVLTIVGFALAVPTLGVSLGLSIAGISTGVAAGVAGGTHLITKEVIIRNICKKATEFFEEDKKEFENLKEKVSDLNHLIQDVTSRYTVNSSVVGMAAGIGRVGNSVGRLTFNIIDIVFDFARVGGKVLAPFAGIFAVVDAIIIGYNAKKLSDGELSEKAKQLSEPLSKLKEGLQETTKWFKETVPSDLQHLIDSHEPSSVDICIEDLLKETQGGAESDKFGSAASLEPDTKIDLNLKDQGKSGVDSGVVSGVTSGVVPHPTLTHDKNHI